MTRIVAKKNTVPFGGKFADDSVMEVRLAKPSDYKDLLPLLNELGYSPGDAQAVFGQILGEPSMGIFVVENSSHQIEGFVSFSVKPQLRLNGLSMEIDELIVSSKARGSGAGRLLIEAAKKEALRRNCVRIVLTTNRDRESYKRDFYKKNGFVETNSALLKMPLRS